MFHTLKSSSRFSYVKLRISSFMEDYLISDVYTETDNTFIKRRLNYYISSVISVFVIGIIKVINISHINFVSNLSFI